MSGEPKGAKRPLRRRLEGVSRLLQSENSGHAEALRSGVRSEEFLAGESLLGGWSWSEL